MTRKDVSTRLSQIIDRLVTMRDALNDPATDPARVALIVKFYEFSHKVRETGKAIVGDFDRHEEELS